MRMKGHAQHDPAEYVPKPMFDFWKQQDPIARYEAYLTEHKLWDAAKKSEIDARIDRELDADQKFAEESPLPAPEIAEQGVYCDGCHAIQADWRRDKKEVTPPKSSEEAVWKVADFGAFKSSAPEPKPAPLSKESAVGGRNSLALGAAEGNSEVPEVKDSRASALEAEVEVEVAKQVPLRVPFGRGPKDRSVELELRNKAPEPHHPRHPHHKPHKRRRR
jgi:hypothetical protein